MNRELEMVKAYIRGALRGPRPSDDNEYLLGFETGIRSVRDFIEAMERPIEEVEKKNEDSQFSLLTLS